jgi:flavin reductase (DIM6/NTAB) family NADH-FMN oxidoreductase RutF
VANAAETREFCWNLATESLAESMNLTCSPAPAHVDEFAVAGLTHAPSRIVDVPRVLESPVNFECKVTQILQLHTAMGDSVQTWLVLGEVVVAHIDRRVIVEGVYDILAAKPIMRAGGLGDYFKITPDDSFFMARPGWAVD